MKLKVIVNMYLLILCIFVLTACGMLASDEGKGDADTQSVWEEERVYDEADKEGFDSFTDKDSASDKLYVHVCGCVKNPGLYELEAGERVGNAIETAGGFTKKADRDGVNLASFLEDGMQILVPKKETQVSANKDSGKGSSEDGSELININTASIEQLTSLNGIGETRAEAIITYREENGTFKDIEDIKNVSGIGDSTFENIKKHITV